MTRGKYLQEKHYISKKKSQWLDEKDQSDWRHISMQLLVVIRENKSLVIIGIKSLELVKNTIEISLIMISVIREKYHDVWQ